MNSLNFKRLYLILLLGALVCSPMGQTIAANSGDGERVAVRTVLLSQMGMLVDDPHWIFGIVNLGNADCLAVVPPEGSTLIAGRNHVFAEATDVPKILRDALTEAYPGCRIVKVIHEPVISERTSH